MQLSYHSQTNHKPQKSYICAFNHFHPFIIIISLKLLLFKCFIQFFIIIIYNYHPVLFNITKYNHNYTFINVFDHH